MQITKEQYVAAYHWFGWKIERARAMYEEGVRRDDLVREYLRHMK